MEQFIKNHKVLSLGYNCYMKKYMNDMGINQETNLFDFIGTSMWSINELFLNNFNGLIDYDNYKRCKIFTHDKNDIIINEKYYVRFPHEFKNKENKKIFYYSANTGNNKYNYKFVGCRKVGSNDLMNRFNKGFNELSSTLERRVERLKKILLTEETVLFLRLEEENKNRIEYDMYKKYNKSEIEYINEFSDIIKKQYPKLDFKIIFVTKNHDSSKNDNIIILKNNIGDLNYDNFTEKFKEIIKNNMNLIN